MKERPILFSGAMVRAILAGTKTQTRRLVKPQPLDVDNYDGAALLTFSVADDAPSFHIGPKPEGFPCPYGQPGDRLWVRETWAPVNSSCGPGFLYRADNGFEQPEYDGPDYGGGPSFNYEKYPANYSMWWEDLLSGADGHNWTPSIHMPRWASRITLEIESVRIERLKDISEEEATAEGVTLEKVATGVVDESNGVAEMIPEEPSEAYRKLWESINGPGSWDANPWVWVVTFKRVEGRAA